MCNLSEGIEERAMAIGQARGEVRGAEKMSINIILNMYNNNFTIEQIALATQTNVDEINKIIKITFDMFFYKKSRFFTICFFIDNYSH